MRKGAQEMFKGLRVVFNRDRSVKSGTFRIAQLHFRFVLASFDFTLPKRDGRMIRNGIANLEESALLAA